MVALFSPNFVEFGLRLIDIPQLQPSSRSLNEKTVRRMEGLHLRWHIMDLLWCVNPNGVCSVVSFHKQPIRLAIA